MNISPFSVIIIPAILLMLLPFSCTSCSTNPQESSKEEKIKKPTVPIVNLSTNATPNPSPPPSKITTEVLENIRQEGTSYKSLVATLEKINNNEAVDLNKKSKEFEETPLMVTTQLKRDSTLLLKVLLEKGADLTITDSSNRQALHHAVIAGNLEAVKLLVAAMQEKGLSLKVKSNFGGTAYQEAKKQYKLAKGEHKKVYKEIKELLRKAMTNTQRS